MCKLLLVKISLVVVLLLFQSESLHLPETSIIGLNKYSRKVTTFLKISVMKTGFN